MLSRVLALTLLFSLSAIATLGQGQGRGGPSSRSGMQGEVGPQGARGMTNQGQAQPRNETDARLQAAARRQQYQDCLRITSRLRSRLRQMTRLGHGQSVSADQAASWRREVQNEIRTVQQQQELVRSHLTGQEQAEAAERLRQVDRAQQQLEGFSEALGFELEQAAPDPVQIRDKARQTDASVRDLQKQQHELADELGIQI